MPARRQLKQSNQLQLSQRDDSKSIKDTKCSKTQGPTTNPLQTLGSAINNESTTKEQTT